MKPLRPIETVYKGYRFRSRLEARWAVFFDALDVAWDYETEGFDLGGGLRYLPDFWLPKESCFIEVKPFREPEEAEIEKCRALAEYHPVFMLMGVPERPAFSFDGEELLATGAAAFCFPKIIGGHAQEVFPYWDGRVPRMYFWHERLVDPGGFVLWPVPSNEVIDVESDGKLVCVDSVIANLKSMHTPRLLHAYDAARRARFEFGENGA